MKSINFEYNDFIEKIEKGETFSFARYGDGEWNAIFSKAGQNCDGHQYFPDMGTRLQEIVKSGPAYIMGMQNMAKRLMGTRIDKLLDDNKVDIGWSNSDILHHANIKGHLPKLFEVLKNKRVHLVGPVHLKPIKPFIDYNELIIVPEKNCWNQYEQIKNKLITTLDSIGEKGDIVLFCASMMSNVLVDDMYNKYQDKYSFLDVGSIFEPHIGMTIRSYHKKLIT